MVGKNLIIAGIVIIIVSTLIYIALIVHIQKRKNK